MLAYLQILRPKNLILIGITQFVLYYFIILPNVETPDLDIHLFVLLVIVTVIIAASGFIINDIFDYRSDAINKPTLSFIPHPISLKNAWIFYVFLLIFGFFLAFYVAISIHNLPLLILYPLATIVLFFYSKSWKNSILIGNVVVSLFVSFVTGIVFFAERNSIYTLKSLEKQIWVVEILTAYMIFSFLINLIREIVKDMEDIDGDCQAQLVTFPIKYGLIRSRILVVALSSILIGLVAFWLIFNGINLDFRAQMMLVLFVMAPLIVVIQTIMKRMSKMDFSQASSILKWVMIAGIFSIILISKTHL